MFLCTVTDFSAAEKARGVIFGMHVGLLSGQVFSPSGEVWLAGSHGGGILCGSRNWHNKVQTMRTRTAHVAVLVLMVCCVNCGEGQWPLAIGGGGIA